MASRAVTVLTPNGRRQTVKCTLNTTILQIIEDVCKKQGFNSADYDLKHHNKVVDTSLTVRFSGLPNNAQLELVASTKSRQESEITVALNLEDGSRVLGDFLPSSTLQDILDKLYNSQEPNPVVIYMRREIYGEDLVKTDLRSLGLTGGRAMLRVMHRTPEELKTQANISNAIPAKPVAEKPYKRVFVPVQVEETKHSEPTKKVEETSEKIACEPKNYSARPDILKLAKEKIPEKKAVTEETSSMDVDPQDVNENNVDTVMDIDESSTAMNRNENLAQFKLEDLPFTGIRNGLIFLAGDRDPRQYDEPPDDFFNLTLDDAKTILRDNKRNVEEAQEGGPLMTAALRELEESKKQLRYLNKYKKCVVRIQFPDRVILQGLFTPKDSIKTVMEFVKQHLANAEIPFHLYTTPPKCILPEEKLLIEVNLVPSSLVYFGIEEKYKSDDLQFLRGNLKDKQTTSSIASLAAHMLRQEDMNRNSDENPVAGCSKDSNSLKRNLNSGGKVPKWFKGT